MCHRDYDCYEDDDSDYLILLYHGKTTALYRIAKPIVSSPSPGTNMLHAKLANGTVHSDRRKDTMTPIACNKRTHDTPTNLPHNCKMPPAPQGCRRRRKKQHATNAAIFGRKSYAISPQRHHLITLLLVRGRCRSVFRTISLGECIRDEKLGRRVKPT